MKDERRSYVLVGAFVIAMVAALVAWLALLSGRTGATDPYHIHYDNVMGLSEGTQIYFQGYPVGLIEAITPDAHDGRPGYRVDVSIRRGWRIPADSLARITASGLLAAVVVDIEAGASAEALEPGSRIPSEEAQNLLAAVSSVAGQVQQLAREQVGPLVDQLSARVPEIVGNLQTFSTELNDTLARVKQVVSPENTRRIGTILDNLDSTTRNFSDVSRDLSDTRLRVDELLVQVTSLVDENRDSIDHTLVDLHDTLESIAARIDAISHNLESTSRNLSEFSLQVRRNPGVLLRGRDVDDGEVP